MVDDKFPRQIENAKSLNSLYPTIISVNQCPQWLKADCQDQKY